MSISADLKGPIRTEMMRRLSAYVVLFIIGIGLFFPSTSSAEPLLMILPGHQVPGGCMVDGDNCAMVIEVPEPNPLDPFGTGNLLMGSTSLNAGSEVYIGTDLYECAATNGTLSSYRQAQFNVYSHTGRNVISDAIAAFPAYTFVNW